MGEEKTPWFEPTFNRAAKVLTIDQRLTSDAGAILLREVDHRLGLIESIGEQLTDPRSQKDIRYALTELLRERIFAQALGYSADDDVDRLAFDPAMRAATWDRPGQRGVDERLGSQPTQSRLLDNLGDFKGNLEIVRRALPDWVERHLRVSGNDRAARRGTLDVDSFPITVRGSQPGGAYNGYYKETVYHPLVAGFASEGDYDSKRLGDGFVHAILRAGNVHTAEGATRFIREAIKRCSGLARTIDVRFDAGFTSGNIMDALTDDGTRFVGRIKSNAVLERLGAPHLVRPVGRPPKEGYEYTVELGDYQAEDWRYAQRLILVVVDKPDPKTGQLEFFPRYFFLVTNRPCDEISADGLLQHYRRRGTFEDRIGELSQAIAPRLSSPRFEENEASLLLSLLSYNLLSIVRGELEDTGQNGWSLERVQKSVLKAGARFTKGGHRILIHLALAVVPLWNRLIKRIERWRLPERWSKPRGPRKRKWVPPPAHAHLNPVLRN